MEDRQMLDPELVTYLDQRFARVDDRLAELGQELRQELGRELRQGLGRELRQELGRELRQGLGEELRQELGRELRQELGHGLGEGFRSLRAHVDEKIREVLVLVEDTHTRIQLVAEGVIATQESLAAFRAEVDHEFEEVKAVNRLSYVELERKIAALGG
jgi:hypothetical protein